MQRLIFCVLLTLIPGASAALEADDRQTCLNDALKPEQVITACNQALTAEPDNFKLLLRRGKLHLLLRHYPQAVTDLSSALAIRPDSLARLYRGFAYSALGEFRLADIDYYHVEALIQNPRDYFAFLIRGQRLLNAKEPEAALEDFSAALRLNPDGIDALLMRSKLLDQSGRHEEALIDSERLLARQPELTEAWLLKASALRGSQGEIQALKYISAQIAAHPENIQLLLDRVQNYNSLTDAEILADLDRVIKLDPNHFKALSLRARHHARLHHFELSLADLNRLITLEPHNPDILKERVYLYGVLTRFEDALKDTRVLLSLKPDSQELLTDEIRILSLISSSAEVLRTSDSLIVRFPDSDQGYLIRSRIRMNRTDLQGALADLEHAAKLGAQDWAAYNRPYLYGLMRDWPRAEQALTDAREHFAGQSYDLEILNEFEAWIWYLRGQPDKSLRLLRQLKFKPEDVRFMAWWIQDQMPLLLGNFPGIAKLPGYTQVEQSLEKARQGDEQALLNVYEGMVQLLKDWQAESSERI